MITDTGKEIIATLVDDPNLTDDKSADYIADIDILRPPVSDDDVAQITRMSRDEQDALKLKIKQLDLRLILPPDKQGYGVVCPYCGNGSGHDGDGVTVNLDDSDGHFWYHCFKCGNFEGDLINIIATVNGLDISSYFYKILAIGKKLLALAENSSVKPAAITKTRKSYSDEQISFFKSFREKSQSNIEQLPLEDRRGLSIDTLNALHFGYDPNTKRIIIPTGDFSYNAILINSQRKFFVDNGIDYDKCLNYGSKAIFNPSAIVPNKPIIITEGEIDAASIWQASGVNVCAIGGTSNTPLITFIAEHIPVENRKDYTFLVMLDIDSAGKDAAKKLTEDLINCGCPAVSEDIVSSSTKIDANDILIQNGSDSLKACIDSAISKFNDKIDAVRKKMTDNSIVESKPRVRKPTTKEIMPDCPIDLRIPAKFDFSNVGISYDGNLICNTPVVITKKLRDVETGEIYSEIAYYDRYSKKWFVKHFSDDVLLDKRTIGKLMKFGISFTQDDAKNLTKYFKDLPFEPHNLLAIPHHNLYSRTGWTDDSFTKFIYPNHLDDGDVLHDPNGMFTDKFSTKGDFKKWCKAIKKLFTNKKVSNAFRLIFGAAAAAPLYRVLGLRNSQFLLWCSSGKGKSAIAKIASSIYGNPEALKHTFNGTVHSINSIPAYFIDFFIWMDEFQSAPKAVRDDIRSIVYGHGEGTTRSRSRRDGSVNPTFKFTGVRVFTAEQPILPDNTDAGAYNRLLSISSDKLFPPDTNIADVHRFFNNNYGHFGIQWIDFIKSHIEEIRAKFAENQSFFSDIARAFHWTNGWTDDFAAILTALQFAIPLLDQDEIKLSADDVKNLFIDNFDEIEREIPRESSFSNQQRAISMLEDYINSHPRFFKREVKYGSVHTMKQSTDGNSFELYGFQFLDGTFGFIPTALNKIIQNDLGFSSATAILRGWQDEGLLQPANNKSAYARRKKVIDNGNIRNMTLVCFNENVLNADMSVDTTEDHTDE